MQKHPDQAAVVAINKATKERVSAPSLNQAAALMKIEYPTLRAAKRFGRTQCQGWDVEFKPV